MVKYFIWVCVCNFVLYFISLSFSPNFILQYMNYLLTPCVCHLALICIGFQILTLQYKSSPFIYICSVLLNLFSDTIVALYPFFMYFACDKIMWNAWIRICPIKCNCWRKLENCVSGPHFSMALAYVQGRMYIAKHHHLFHITQIFFTPFSGRQYLSFCLIPEARLLLTNYWTYGKVEEREKTSTLMTLKI